jgi:hypothetical protein
MPARKKINLEKVNASLATPCPQWGHEIKRNTPVLLAVILVAVIGAVTMIGSNADNVFPT